MADVVIRDMLRCGSLHLTAPKALGPSRPHDLDFLNFRVEEVDDRVSSLEAMASTRIDLHAKVMAEAQAVLDWAWSSFPTGHGPVDDGADWDHDIQVLVEDGGWHTVTVTFTGTTRFVEAFIAAFDVAED